MGGILFQSTLPARGATFAARCCRSVRRNFNPRSPHGERPRVTRISCDWGEFQSTLPARGATAGYQFPRATVEAFQSTLPARGATETRRMMRRVDVEFQSTLPARGATHVLDPEQTVQRHFNPRSPHGERRLGAGLCAGGAAISIHAPRTGSDRGRADAQLWRWYFNPRSPHGERRSSILRDDARLDLFQSTLPARGATPPVPGAKPVLIYFNPRSPHGERLRKVTILSIRIIGFAQKVYHKTVLLRISLAENAVILPKRPQNPVRTSLQKAGGLRFARAIRAARPYSISSPSGA